MNENAQSHGDWRLWTPLQFFTRSMELFTLTAESSHLMTVKEALNVTLDIGPTFVDQEPFDVWNQKVLQILKQSQADTKLDADELREVAYHIYNLIAVEALDKEGNAISGPRYLFKRSIRKHFQKDEDEFKTNFKTPLETLQAVSNAVKTRIRLQLGYNNDGYGQATTATTRLSNHEEIFVKQPGTPTPKLPKANNQNQTLNSLANASDSCRGKHLPNAKATRLCFQASPRLQ